MSRDKLSRLLSGIESAGVRRGERNKTVAEKTGYSVGTVNRILSGNAALTVRFIQAVCAGFGVNRGWVENGEAPILTPVDNAEMKSVFGNIQKKVDVITGRRTIEPQKFSMLISKDVVQRALARIAKSREALIGEIINMLQDLSDRELAEIHTIVQEMIESSDDKNQD